MPLLAKLITMLGLIVASMAAGWYARRRGWVREDAAKWIMTWVAVGGYPPIDFLCIWGIRLEPADALLPVAGMVHNVLMMLIALGVGRLILTERPERGLFAVAGGVANHGTTMGGFVLFLLFGEAGLARASIYTLLFWPVVVLLAYPIARRYADCAPQGPRWRMYLASVLDYRSIGLAVSLAAIAMSLGHVPRPAAVVDWHVVDVLVYALVVVAYFGIGLRLHASQIRSAWRLICGLAVVRFGVGVGLGLTIVALTRLTPWPLEGITRQAFLVQAFVPTAVIVVAISNMFDLRPQTASVLFVTNTLAYLAFVLPWVLWAFGG